uniref:C2H2-type domain-containing protein n=1 Tax=Mycena chlorophos TaxID=658473 RepID=A0ABQ0LVL1_MYCCL|nr:predicted protein [Mycena chlorophos]
MSLLSRPASPLSVPGLAANGSTCHRCRKGVLLFTKYASGNRNEENCNRAYRKCSRCYDPNSTVAWITSAARAGACDYFVFLSSEDAALCERQANARCPKNAPCGGNGIRNGSCEHYMCKACCLHFGRTDPAHVCNQITHRTTPTGSSSVPGPAVSTPSTPRRPPPSLPTPWAQAPFPGPGQVLGTHPAPVVLLPQPAPSPFRSQGNAVNGRLPIHGLNLSANYQSDFSPEFIAKSLSQTHSPLSSYAIRRETARKASNFIKLKWYILGDAIPVPLEVQAPKLPNFIPSECVTILQTFGLKSSELESFAFFSNGGWAIRDTPLAGLTAGNEVFIGPARLVVDLVSRQLPLSTRGPQVAVVPTTPSRKRNLSEVSRDVILIDDDDDDASIADSPQKRARPQSRSPATAIFPPADPQEADRGFRAFEALLAEAKEVRRGGEVVLKCAAAAFGVPIKRRNWNRHYAAWQEKQGHENLARVQNISPSSFMEYTLPDDVLDDTNALTLAKLRLLWPAAHTDKRSKLNANTAKRAELVAHYKLCRFTLRERGPGELSTRADEILDELGNRKVLYVPPQNPEAPTGSKRKTGPSNAQVPVPKKKAHPFMPLAVLFIFRDILNSYEVTDDSEMYTVKVSSGIRAGSPHVRRTISIDSSTIIQALEGLLRQDTFNKDEFNLYTLSLSANDVDYTLLHSKRYREVTPALERCSALCVKCSFPKKEGVVLLDAEPPSVHSFQWFTHGAEMTGYEAFLEREPELRYKITVVVARKYQHQWEDRRPLKKKEQSKKPAMILKDHASDKLLRRRHGADSEVAAIWKAHSEMELSRSGKLRAELVKGYGYEVVLEWAVWGYDAFRDAVVIAGGNTFRISGKSWARFLKFKQDPWVNNLFRCGHLIHTKCPRGLQQLRSLHGDGLKAKFGKQKTVAPETLFAYLCELYHVAARDYDYKVLNEGEEEPEGEEVSESENEDDKEEDENGQGH